MRWVLITNFNDFKNIFFPEDLKWKVKEIEWLEDKIVKYFWENLYSKTNSFGIYKIIFWTSFFWFIVDLNQKLIIIKNNY